MLVVQALCCRSWHHTTQYLYRYGLLVGALHLSYGFTRVHPFCVHSHGGLRLSRQQAVYGAMLVPASEVVMCGCCWPASNGMYRSYPMQGHCSKRLCYWQSSFGVMGRARSGWSLGLCPGSMHASGPHSVAASSFYISTGDIGAMYVVRTCLGTCS